MDSTNKLIYAFIALIVGIVLLGTVSSITNSVASLSTIVNETTNLQPAIADGIINTSYTFAVSNPGTVDCPNSAVVIVNGTNNALASGTDYMFNLNTGTFTLAGTTVNTSKLWENNNSYISYSYCGSDYVNLAWGRSILNTVVGMFALAILVVSVALFFSVARDYGLI